MPTVLDTAKEATYAAVGLNVLLVEELNERITEQRDQLTEQMNERFADQRSQVDEQLDLAREHGQKARERMQPLAQRSWEFYESTVTRIGELAPAPIDGYVTDGLARIKDFVGPEITGTEAKKAPAKKATKKPAAKKTPATKAAADDAK